MTYVITTQAMTMQAIAIQAITLLFWIAKVGRHRALPAWEQKCIITNLWLGYPKVNLYSVHNYSDHNYLSHTYLAIAIQATVTGTIATRAWLLPQVQFKSHWNSLENYMPEMVQACPVVFSLIRLLLSWYLQHNKIIKSWNNMHKRPDMQKSRCG